MKLFLDSAKTDEIKRALELWDVDGLTTNPKHVQASGKPFRKVIVEIAELFGGTAKPISVEVNPHLTDWKQIVEQGVELSRLSPNFVIKVGASESGFKAIRELTGQGVRVNAILPGAVDTDMYRSMNNTAESQAFVTNLHALKRVASPEELARSVLYLASDESAFVTGTASLVDGGVSITRT